MAANSASTPRRDYWALEPDGVYSALGSGRNGLTSGEVQNRQKAYGLNEIPHRGLRWSRVMFRQVNNPLVLILVVAAAVSGVLGQTESAAAIILIIVLGVFLGFYNEYKAERIVEDLRRNVSVKTVVVRDGKTVEVEASQLVPGDLVLFYVGDIAAADVRIVEAKDVQADESVLTGESFPVDKTSNSLSLSSVSPQQLTNYLFMGTVVAHGSGRGVVVATGKGTEFGGISSSLAHPHAETEFQRGIKSYGKMLMTLAVCLTVGIFVLNALVGHALLNSLLFALAIAVGLVPELMPAIVTISLSHGAQRIARKKVIVKRLVSIEDFGNMDTLCTDKTGTLTEGKISLKEIDPMAAGDEQTCLTYSLLCNAAAVGEKIIGSPMDVALWDYAIKTKAQETVRPYTSVDQIPFDYERRLMSTAVRYNGRTLMITKGAPESVIAACKSAKTLTGTVPVSEVSDQINKELADHAKAGYRVIALSYREVEEKQSYSAEDERDLVLLGLLVFTDPPKLDSGQAIEKLKQMSVNVKILTGDSDLVAVKLCEDMKIQVSGVVHGPDLVKMNTEEFHKAVEASTIFARITPNQKLDIIRALKANGHVVGFMGDGVNDAPALYEADVGISVDSAVDVSKDAADIVLLEKDLLVLADGIDEGRKVFGNTTKYILMGTSSNFGNMFSAAAASILLPFLPMLPVQILFMNLFYDIANFTLPTDSVDEEYTHWPRRWDIGFVRKFTLFFGPFSSLYDFLTFGIMLFIFGCYVATPHAAALFQTGWFVESFWTEVLVIFVIRTRRIPFFSSRPSRWLTILTLSAVAIGTIIPFTLIGSFLGFVPLPPAYWALLMLMVATYLLLVDAGKVFFYRVCKL